MSLAEIRDLVSGVGFPIFVAIFLLVYMRRTMDANTAALDKLTDAITRICDKLGVKPPST